MTCERTCDCDACTITAWVADVLGKQFPAREDGIHEVDLAAVVSALSTHIGFALSVTDAGGKKQLIDLAAKTIMDINRDVYISGGVTIDYDNGDAS